MANLIKAKHFGQFLVRAGVPIGAFALCLHWLAPHLTASLWAGFPQQLSNISAGAWAMAIALTALSLWSVGRYDGVAHQHFQTRVPQQQARAAGTISIALAQTLGFGIFTGTLARWRMLRGISLGTSLKLSTFVSITFMISWAIVAAISCLILPAPDWTFYPALIVIALVPLGLCTMFRWPKLALNRWRIRFPNLKASAAIFLWTLIDTSAVAAALFVLLPNNADLAFSTFFPLFLLALGTALFLNTPGGVGPFELMMLSLLPQLPTAEVLGSIIAFRIVYYAVPAFIAVLALMLPFKIHHPALATQTPVTQTHNQPELQIITQNGGKVLNTANGSWAIWPNAQILTMLGNPISGNIRATIKALQAEAKEQGKLPFIYKCNARTAQGLRNHHWSMIHLSDDALVTPQSFDLTHPSLRRLRRKLRSAKKSGLSIRTDAPQPWSELQSIDHTWQSSHGTARGGTMGRFEVGYLTTQFIARAYHKGQLCAFVTFQKGANEWCLDVMRHHDDIPDGTMHALVHRAIIAAQREGIERLSLAAVPACPDPSSAFFRWAARHAVIKAGGTGLRQFKSTFAPKWEARYAAAPSRLALLIGLADITREVHHPDPITPSQSHEIHNCDEYYELPSKQAS